MTKLIDYPCFTYTRDEVLKAGFTIVSDDDIPDIPERPWPYNPDDEEEK